MSNINSTIIAESSKKRSFLSGLEESLARLMSFFITLLFFIVYSIAAGNKLVLEWSSLLGFLALFWFLYEFVAFLLFMAFTFFSRSRLAVVSNKNDENELLEELNLDKKDEGIEN